MSKSKLLYLVFLIYILFVFLPINLLMYFPSISPFKISFLEKLEQNNLKNSQSIVSEATSPVISVNNTSTENLEGATPKSETTVFGSLSDIVPVSNDDPLLEGYIQGVFNECTSDNCSRMYISNKTNKDLSRDFIFNEDTSLYCVNHFVNGTDMATTFVDFSRSDQPFIELLGDRKSNAIKAYAKDSPVQYHFDNDTLLWLSIYLDNCDEFK